MKTTSKNAEKAASPFASQNLVRVAENLYRNGNDTYYVKFKKDGKQYKQSLETHDRAKANRKLAEFIEKIENKTEEKEDVLFTDLADEWLATIKPRMKDSSYARRVSSLNTLKPFFKGRKVREVGHEQLTAWEKSRTGVSNRTFNVDRETLRLVLQYAVKPRHILSVNPIDKETMPKRKEKKAVVVPPTREQFKALLEAIRQNKYTRGAHEYVEMLAYTGMRLEELNSVTWADVDFEKDTLRITGGETGTKNHSQRSIPLFAPAKNLLVNILENKKPSDMPQSQTVFKQKSARSAMKTACELIGLDETAFTHHDLRHFFCTNAIEKNIPDHVIASWLGHQDGGILVKRTYGDLRAGHSAEMAKLMDFTG